MSALWNTLHRGQGSFTEQLFHFRQKVVIAPPLLAGDGAGFHPPEEFLFVDQNLSANPDNRAGLRQPVLIRVKNEMANPAPWEGRMLL
jgi:hypothetical protein